jgi:hypothetical protein
MRAPSTTMVRSASTASAFTSTTAPHCSARGAAAAPRVQSAARAARRFIALLAHHELQARPHVAHGADLHVHPSLRQRELADGVLGHVGGDAARTSWATKSTRSPPDRSTCASDARRFCQLLLARHEHVGRGERLGRARAQVHARRERSQPVAVFVGASDRCRRSSACRCRACSRAACRISPPSSSSRYVDEVPVEYEDSSESSHRIARATSSGSPPRFMRDGGLHAIDAARARRRSRGSRVDDAGPHRVHADALGGDFPGESRW